jgi:xanthine dehydrogenase YagR molybdenum-binding subunit
MMKTVGNEIPRIDGPLKVSGKATYTSDFHFPGMLYGVPVKSTIAKGHVESLNTSKAEKMPGVHKVFHRGNLSKTFRTAPDTDFTAYVEEHRPPFEDDVIRYHGQFLALVVAETFEQAEAAAHAVEVVYRKEDPNVAADLGLAKRLQGGTFDPDHAPLQPGGQRGDAEKAFLASDVKIDHTYTTPPETHSAIELHATTAVWEGDSVTIYETSQAVVNHRSVLFQQLGVGKEKVRVISKFLGSGFGGKLFPWPHSVLAAAAARDAGRPVKLVLDRATVFQVVGHRPSTQQRVRIGASADGKLTSLQHDYVNQSAILDDYAENCAEATANLYSVANLRIASGLSRRNVGNPTAMRGPGAVPGLFATETAMDELAVALNMDPVQLRILNEPKIDESSNMPFSSRHLVECYRVGAENFGWSNRNPRVGSMKQGGLTLGWGMASCMWIAGRFPAEAMIDLRDDGTARVSCGTQDIGTGTYTMLAQIASERLGIPVEKIEVVLGDTVLPPGPINGGSLATASIVPAVFQASDGAVQKLLLAISAAKDGKFSGKRPDELAFTEGRVHLKNQPASNGTPFGKLLQEAHVRMVSGSGKDAGSFGAKSDVSTHSFGAHFVEVTWDEAIARLRVNRVVSVIDGGKIINPKMARNQIQGSVAMGIGMGILEETLYDSRSGSPINGNFADYLMPTNADVPRVDVHFLDYPDKAINEIGARGVGEIGLAGTAAAIGNAVYHATGIRVRDLPISIEKLLV